MNNNHILARWRDAITDPPEHIKNVIIRQKEKDDAVGYWSLTYCQWHDLFGESFEVEPGDQWLDITDIPAVPRAAVQAAVDEMHAEAARRDVRTHGYGCNDDLIYALEVLRDKCGGTPTEVTK